MSYCVRLKPFAGDNAESLWCEVDVDASSCCCWLCATAFIDATEPVEAFRKPPNEMESRFFLDAAPLTVALGAVAWRVTRAAVFVEGEARTESRCPACIVTPFGI